MGGAAEIAEEAGFEEPVPHSRGPWRRAARRFARRPLGVVALVVLVAMVAAAFLGGRIAPYFVNQINFAFINKAQGPTLHGYHLFGTDYLGRDIFSQSLYGLHTSIRVALLVVTVAVAFGVVVGAVAGYAGGWVDAVLMRLVDLVVTVPAIAIILALLAYLEPLTEMHIGVVLMAYMWTGVARVVRANCVSLREREFVDAAHAAGASPARIIMRHLLPNCAGSIIVAATSVFGQVIVIAATLDFFNVGTTQLSGPTLGNLLADATKYGQLGQTPWWTFAMPALVLVVLLTCVNFVGDCLDEALSAAG
ncbi:MAG TPA: ABC transporter permease [Gaiellaceae bacterium]